jgi:hypothetical protein
MLQSVPNSLTKPVDRGGSTIDSSQECLTSPVIFVVAAMPASPPHWDDINQGFVKYRVPSPLNSGQSIANQAY